MNENTGEISGKIVCDIQTAEYTVKCKNVWNKMKYKLMIGFKSTIFIEQYKNVNISISKNGKVITNANNYYSHCWINLIIESGVYRIRFKFHQNNYSVGNDEMMLGISTDNSYSDYNIYLQNNVCCYDANYGKSQNIHCNIGKLVTENPKITNHGDGSIYEVIFDMNKREFWISHCNDKPILLVKDLPNQPLYPFASLYYQNSSIELLLSSHTV